MFHFYCLTILIQGYSNSVVQKRQDNFYWPVFYIIQDEIPNIEFAE